MPTSIVNNDIWQQRVACYWNGQLSLNVYYWLCGTIVGSPTIENMANLWDAIASPVYKPALTNQASYRGSIFTRVRGGATPGTIMNADAGPGTGGTTPAPTAICGLIARYNNQIGRAGRGRVYIPFPDVSSIFTTGEPTAAYLTKLGSIATAMMLTAQVIFDGTNGFTANPIMVHLPTWFPQTQAGTLVPGRTYQITFVGNTNFVSVGATSNTKGVVFVATGVGSGTGFAREQKTTQTSFVIDRAIARGKWGTQHRRGDYGKLNVQPF